MSALRTVLSGAFLAAIVALGAPAPADPSGYLKPAGDAATVEKAARIFRDGVRLLEKGADGPALSKFRSAAKLCPGFFEARYDAAKLEGERGDPRGHERAVAELEAVCGDFPDNVRAFSDMGQLLVQTDAEAAGKAFEQAVTNGEKLLEDDAIQAAGKATVDQLKVDLAFAYHNRGAWRLGRGEYADAEADLGRSIELNDANFFSHYVLGLALLQEGRPTEARAAFKRAKALKWPFPDCAIGLARTYLAEVPPQPAAAIAELDEAVKTGGTSAQVEMLYGDADRLLGEFDRAVERYTKARTLGSDAATIELKLGVVARDRKDFAAAREHLGRCIEQTEDAVLQARAYRHLGEIAELEEDYETAVEHLARAIELDPEAHGARLHLGVCLYRLGRIEEAAKHLAAAIEACGDPPPAALAADLEQARKLLDEARKGLDGSSKGLDGSSKGLDKTHVPGENHSQSD
jgi:tetratricopeptide (TPR) repeat protein